MENESAETDMQQDITDFVQRKHIFMALMHNAKHYLARELPV